MTYLEDFDDEEDSYFSSAMSERYWDEEAKFKKQRERAQAVIDILTIGFPDNDLDFDDAERSEVVFSLYAKKVDHVIRENLDSESIWQLIHIAGDMRERMIATRNANRRHKVDPKQADKDRVKECWDLWQLDRSRYDGKAAFARDMLSKFEALKSQQVIERWCRHWEINASPY